MKNIVRFFLLLLFTSFLSFQTAQAQHAPAGINYQAVLRNGQGAVIANQSVSIKLSVLDVESNIVFYSEEQSVSTNPVGIINLVIGEGKPTEGSFAEIPWSKGNLWLEVSYGDKGGKPDIVGTTRLLSVPYAMYAEKAGGLDNSGAATAKLGDESAWLIKGNEEIDDNIHFLGTRNYADLVVKTSNFERLRLTKDGQLYQYGDAFFMSNVQVSSDLQVGGNENIDLNLRVNGGASIGRDLEVEGNANFKQNTDMAGMLRVYGDAMLGSNVSVDGDGSVNGIWKVAKDLTVGGNTELFHDLQVGGSTNLDGDVKMGSDLDIDGNTDMGGNLNVDGSAHIGDNVDIDNNLNVDIDVTVGRNMTVNNNVDINNNLNVDQNVTVGNDVTINHNVDIGDDLHVRRDADIDRYLNVDNNVHFAKDLDVDQNATINNNLQVDNNASVGNNLTVTKDASVGNNLTVTKDATINNNLHVVKDGDIDNNLNVDKNITVGGNANIAGDFTVSGNGSFYDITAQHNAIVNNDLTVKGTTIVEGLHANKDFYANKDAYVSGTTNLMNLNCSAPANFYSNVYVKGGGTASIDGRLKVDFTTDGADSDASAYPVEVKGKHGIWIESNGNTGANNFATFAYNGGILGRIEGQTAYELENSYEFIWANAMSAAELALKGAMVIACIAQADAGEVIVWGAEGAVQITKWIEWNTNKENKVGIAYESGSGDYAEWLERSNPAEDYQYGQIVGVRGGKISLNTVGADHVMVVSMAPIVLGNMPEKGRENDFEKVAFMGQVPVRVVGKVAVGDYILASGNNDGYGRAVSPAKMRTEDFARIVGVAWQASEQFMGGMVNVAIGLNTNDMADRLSRQEREMNEMKQQINQIYAKLGLPSPNDVPANPALEASAKTATVAAATVASKPSLTKEDVNQWLQDHSDVLKGEMDKAKKMLADKKINVDLYPEIAAIFNNPVQYFQQQNEKGYLDGIMSEMRKR